MSNSADPNNEVPVSRSDHEADVSHDPAPAAPPRARPVANRLNWLKDALAVEPFWYGLIALLLAYRGQRILMPGQDVALQPDFDVAKIWYIAAIAVMVFGWWNSYTDHSLLVLGKTAGTRSWNAVRERDTAVRISVAVCAVILNIIGIRLLQRDWFSVVGGWLWAISMIVIVAAFWGEPVAGPADEETPVEDRWWRLPRWAEIAAVLAVLTVAILFRLWRLGDLRPGMHGDEGEAGTIGLDILNGIPTSPFARGWFTHSNVYFWSVALCMKIFGTGLAGLRSWAVICGLVTVLFVYLITRDMFGIRAAIIAGFFCAFGSADVLVSRQLSSNAATPMYTAIAFFCLVRGLKTKRHIYFALAGVAAGFNIYYFAGGRLTAPTMVAFLAYLAVVHWRFLPAYWTRVLAFLAAVGVTISPYIAYNMAYPLQPNAYPNDRFIWLHQADFAGIYGATDWRTIVWDQLQRTFSIFTWAADNSANHILDYPVARPFEAVLIVLGLVWALWRWRDSRFTLLSAWFWSAIIAGGVLTTDAPNVPRIVGALPVLAILMAAWLDHWAGAISATVERLGNISMRRAAPWVSGAAIGSIVLVSGMQNWDKYINYYLHTHTQPDVTEQAYYVQQQGRNYRYYDLGAPDIFFGHGDNRFINHGADGVDALNPSNVLPITDNGIDAEKSVSFMIWNVMGAYLPVLQAYYPGGTLQSHPFGDPDQQNPPLLSYVLTHEQIDSHRILHALYAPAHGRLFTRTERTLGLAAGATPPSGLHYPVRATWTGAIVAPSYGPYRFALNAPRASSLHIDGQRVHPGTSYALASHILAQGPHTVRLTAVMTGPRTPVQVLWAPLGAPMTPISRRYLWDNHIHGAWHGEVLASGTSGVTSKRVDAFLGFRATQIGLGDLFPFSASWKRTMRLNRTGLYTFELNSNGSSTLKVDGRIVVNNQGDGNAHQLAGSVSLSAGTHTFQVSYEWQVGVGYLELFWTPPGGTRQLFLGP